LAEVQVFKSILQFLDGRFSVFWIYLIRGPVHMSYIVSMLYLVDVGAVRQ